MIPDEIERLTARVERLQGKLAVAAEVIGLGSESVERDAGRAPDGYLIPTLKALVEERDRLRKAIVIHLMAEYESTPAEAMSEWTDEAPCHQLAAALDGGEHG